MLMLLTALSHLWSCPQIGFIGLGNMGKHMAANLLKAGHSVVVYDGTVAHSTEAPIIRDMSSILREM